MADLYDVLSVPRDASQSDLRKAYRRLAKKHHPDLNPDDKESEKRFKDISAAYAILGNEDKRARYDDGEIDDTGAERPEQHYYRHYAEQEPGFKYYRQTRPGGAEDLGDIFSDLFGQRGFDSDVSFSARGGDLNYTLTVDFLDAVNGAKQTVTMPDGKKLSLTIPAGIKDGQTLRLKGKGRPGIGQGESGDALVTINVRDHPVFTRDDETIQSVLDITLGEALSGGKIRVKTVSGFVNLSIPKNSNSGDTLRLRGKGAMNRSTGKRGDHFVELRVKLPEDGDEGLRDLIADWEAKHPYNPRGEREAVS